MRTGNPRGSAPNPAGAAPLRPAKTILRRANAGAVLSLPLVGDDFHRTAEARKGCSDGRYLRVARPTHLVSKPFKQAAIRAIA